MSKKTGYSKIAIPFGLVEEIKRIIAEYPQLGFKTVPEFIKESIRNHLREIIRVYD